MISSVRTVRDQLLDAVRRRISAHDPEAILAQEALAEVDQLLGYLATPEGIDVDVAYPLGLFALLCAELRGEAGTRDRTAALTLLMPIYLAQPDALPDPVRSWIGEQRGADLAHVPGQQALAAARGDVARLLLSRMARLRNNDGSAAVVGLARQAANGLQLPKGHPARAKELKTLGYALLADMQPNPHEADEAALDETITAFRDALDGLRSDDPNYAGCTHGLQMALSAKAERIGDDTVRPQLAEGMAELGAAMADLRESSAELTRALRLSPEDVARQMFSLPGASTADESGPAQGFLIQLLAASSTGDPNADQRLADLFTTHANFFQDMDYLANFAFRAVNATAIQALTGHTGSDKQQPWLLPPAPPAEHLASGNLDEIIDQYERALRELPESTPEYQQLQFMRAVLLRDRIPIEDRASRMAHMRDVTQQLPAIMQALAGQLANRFSSRDEIENSAAMNTSMLSPFETMSEVADSINRYRRQLAAMSEDEPGRRATLTSLAVALFSRYFLTGEEHILREAVTTVRQTLTADSPAAPQLLFLWGLSARMNAAGSGMSAPADQWSCSGIPGGSTLTWFKIVDGDAPGALLALENERAIMLSSALRTRHELDNLRAADPQLAERFVALRERIPWNLDPGRLSDAHRPEHELIKEWNAVLNEIKSIPGFDRFLLPAPLEFPDLVPAADDGPVVTINLNEVSCDALVLHDGGARVVPLPRLNLAELAPQAAAFRAAIDTLSTRPPGTGSLAGLAAVRVTMDTLAWLWDVLAEPVLDALGFTEPPADGVAWPRLWWSPAGPLNFLPLHAAGHHATTGASVLDRVVSSYTPTLRALLRSRSCQPPSRQRTALAVAMPETAGHAALPATGREATAIATNLAGTALIGPDATCAAVRAALPGATLAHFACHAKSDPAHAAASHLLLHDGPLNVTEISQLRLDSAELGYVSACATARGSAALPDEAIHIGSALQLAGYPQVVGTLWEVSDDIAARTAADFYRELAPAINRPDRLTGALALHTVTRRMRTESPAAPWEWAAYGHAGA